YGAFPLELRRAIALDFHHRLAERTGELVDVMVAEGHPRRLAEWEIDGMLHGTDPATIDWHCEELERNYEMRGRRIQLVRKPDGVVCMNPPQNAAGSCSTLGVLALLAGNALVVKAPRSTPLSTMFLYQEIIAPLLREYGAPAGTTNVISGETRRILRTWLNSPDVDDVVFFGDSGTGLRIGADCVAKGKKPVLELSGNDGFVVWHDADLDAAADALTQCFYGSSQICMVPKYAVVHPGVADDFAELLLARVEGIRPGYPDDPETLLSPVLKADRYFDFLAEAREEGCEVLIGGHRVDVHGEPDVAGLFCEPTVVRVDGMADARRLACVREETFFPLLPLVVPEPAGDAELLEKTIRFLNSNEYGLRNSVWAGDDAVLERFARRLTNGGLLKLNDSHIGFVSVLATHGGTGRTGGPYGELNYVGLRTTHLQGISWGLGVADPFDSLVHAGASGAAAWGATATTPLASTAR
ncbi:MAG: aldehyde dehydrogenase, partial [Actinomycetota bacterium]|nr:aldehyde dehydrogenase [Actinomycetota bacterium]